MDLHSGEFIEVIGVVESASDMEADTVVKLGDSIGKRNLHVLRVALTLTVDPALANFVVSQWHKPKFANMY